MSEDKKGMQGPNLTIVIGSVKVLEAIMGQDQEVKIKLCESIAVEYAKRNLKPVVDQELRKELDRFRNEICGKAVLEYANSLGFVQSKNNWGNVSYSLSPTLKEQLKTEFTRCWGEYIEDQMKTAFESIDFETAVQKRIDRLVLEKAKKRVDELVDKQINELSRVRLKSTPEVL